MVEQASYCRGEGDTVGCHIDNQPCLCLRESWERRRNECQCWSINEADTKVWMCGCKGCEGIEEDGRWKNKASYTASAMVGGFTATEEKPLPTGFCLCAAHIAYDHFCGTCEVCKDYCNIYA